MNRLGLTALVAEIAPRLEGRRVLRVRAVGGDTTAFELGDPAGDTLIVSTAPGLRLLCLAATGDAPRGGDTPQRLRAAKGGTISSVGLGLEGPTAVVALSRRDPVGLESKAALIIDLGRRPGISLDTMGRIAPITPAGDGRSAAAVSSWRDDTGRTHVRIGASPHRNAEHEMRFDSWNEAARFAYDEYAGAMRDDRRRSEVLRSLARTLKRKRRAVERVKRGLEQARRSPELRQKGQLLLAKKHEFRRGQSVQRLTDFDGETVVEIEVDPRLGAVENAEALFRRAKKGERVATRSPQRLGELERDIEKLEREVDAARDASGVGLGKLADRHDRRTPRQDARKHDEKIRFRRYTVSGGWEVLVGKSNRDNDLLTQRVAAPSDLWFHARQAPGSHVVLRRAGRKEHPDKRAILETAAIAAYHSKAGKSSKVAVLYTEKRHVRKPRGAKPGLVTVSREEVVLVRPAIPTGNDPE